MALEKMKKKDLLTLEYMDTLSTQRLLAYKNKLLTAREGPNWDPDPFEITKQSPEWKKTHSDLKSILKKREHIS